MTIIQERLADLENLTLDRGSHNKWEDGACVMEAVAYITGEWTDHPACVSPVIGAFLRSWNDSLDTDSRQMLMPYVTRVVGTANGSEAEDARAWMCVDWLIREHAVAFLRLAGLDEHAENLCALPAVGPDSVGEATKLCRAARAAAGAAARDAAARDAAARAAARAAAGAAARDAAARDAAAGAAAWAAAWAAAARAAARGALQPTVTQLQHSALQLLDRMIALENPS